MTDELNFEFPIFSQTSDNDKRALLQARDIIGSHGPYSYLEIGSFLGGSLTPFLRDQKCTRILSIDERGRAQPDERGSCYDYREYTNEAMINGLVDANFDISKLETFDGSVDNLPDREEAFDVLFIDGEHTDFACFRDFVHSEKFLKPNSMVIFHDSALIHKALKLINEMLRARDAIFKFFKIKDSQMSFIFFNKLAELDERQLFSIEDDLEAFYARAEKQLLLETVRNRINFDFSVTDMPIKRAIQNGIQNK